MCVRGWHVPTAAATQLRFVFVCCVPHAFNLFFFLFFCSFLLLLLFFFFFFLFFLRTTRGTTSLKEDGA